MKKALTILLAAALVLSLAACGGGSGNDTPSNTPTTPEETPETVKGSRTDPYQFGDEIVVTTTSRDDITATFTFVFEEVFIHHDDVFDDEKPIVRATLSVETADTDGTIARLLGYEIYTEKMVSYDLWERHDDGEYRTDTIGGFLDGVSYDLALMTNGGEIPDIQNVVFSYIKINEWNSKIDGLSEIWVAIPEVSVGVPTSAEFSQAEIDEIDAQLQGTWTVNAAGAEPVYIFNDGIVTVEAIVSGVSGGVNTGSYEIGNDNLGNGQLTFMFDNGVEGNLMFTFSDGKLSLIFSVGNNLYQMGKTSDSVDAGNLGSFWEIYYFIDNFGEPTDEGYITSKKAVRGTFSNSATTNSGLEVWPGIAKYLDTDEKYIFFMMTEYGRIPVNNPSTRNDIIYEIVMRDGDGTDHNITGSIRAGGDRICVDDNDFRTVMDALNGSGEISFFITRSDRPTSTYLFTVETSNFASEYKTLFGNN